MRKGRKMVIVLALIGMTALVMTITRQPVAAGKELNGDGSALPVATAGEQWAMTYDSTGGEDSETAYSVQETSDGGFIVAGTVDPNDSNSGARILKLNSDGVVAWQKTYQGNVGGLVRIHSVQETNDGGYIAAGAQADDAWGAWLLKLNSDGATAWQKVYISDLFPWFNFVQETSDGGFVVAGGLIDLLVLKLNGDGSIVWQQTLDIHNFSDEEAYQVQETSDGGFIITAGFKPPYGSSSAWILKLNSDGVIAWQNVYGNLQGDSSVLSAIQETGDGGYIAAGYTDAFGAGSTDAWVTKINGDGAIVWQKTVGGTGNDVANAIQVTGDGDYVVAGYTSSFGAGSSDAWVFKLNDNGVLVWQKTYGGSDGDSAEAISVTGDGGYVVAGSTDSFSADHGDFWVLRLDSLGEITNCALMGDSQAIVNDAFVEVVDLEPTVQPYPVEAIDVTIASQDIRVDSAVLCGAPGGCALAMAASHNGSELVLDFDLYTGPENVTWGTSLNVMGNWFPLWQTPLPADTSYQNTITLPFPHFGNVAVFTALVAPPNGIVCADYELVDTGAPAANGELPPINKLPRESLGLPPDE